MPEIKKRASTPHRRSSKKSGIAETAPDDAAIAATDSSVKQGHSRSRAMSTSVRRNAPIALEELVTHTHTTSNSPTPKRRTRPSSHKSKTNKAATLRPGTSSGSLGLNSRSLLASSAKHRSLKAPLRASSADHLAPLPDMPLQSAAQSDLRSMAVSGRMPRRQRTPRKHPAEFEPVQRLTTDETAAEREQEEREREQLPPIDDLMSRSLNLTRDNFKDVIELIKPLGCGTYGVVLLVRHRPTERLLAMKKMSKRSIIDCRQVSHVLDEKALLFAARHPFVVEAVDTYNDDNYLYLFLEYVPGGELFTRLRLGAIDVEPAAFYAAEVALALQHLHSLNIAYRDLKPENIVVDAAGHIRLVDFGFARRLARRSWTLCGTPEYLAPEAVLGVGAGLEADWWALGCFIYEMLVGRSPFADPLDGGAQSRDEQERKMARERIYRRIVDGRIKYPSAMPDAAKSLIGGLLTADPAERLTFRQLREHEFFADVDFERLLAKDVNAPWQPTLSGPLDVRHFNVPREDLMRFLKTLPGPKENDPFADF